MLIGLRESPEFCWINMASSGKALIGRMVEKDLIKDIQGLYFNRNFKFEY